MAFITPSHRCLDNWHGLWAPGGSICPDGNMAFQPSGPQYVWMRHLTYIGIIRGPGLPCSDWVTCANLTRGLSPSMWLLPSVCRLCRNFTQVSWGCRPSSCFTAAWVQIFRAHSTAGTVVPSNNGHGGRGSCANHYAWWYCVSPLLHTSIDIP